MAQAQPVLSTDTLPYLTSEMPLCARGGAVKGWLRPVARGERPATPASCGCVLCSTRWHLRHGGGVGAVAAPVPRSASGSSLCGMRLWRESGKSNASTKQNLSKVCTDIHPLPLIVAGAS